MGMKDRMSNLFRCAVLFISIATIGCGGKPTAQISGVVKYSDGSPIEGAARVINFQPTAASDAVVVKAAFSEIAPDGSFELMTRKPGDGVYCGQYTVYFTVLSDPIDPDSSLILPKYSGEEPSPFDVIDVSKDRDDLEFILEKR